MHMSFAGALLMTALPFQAFPAETDCALGNRYHEQAVTAMAAQLDREAYEFLERAVDTCPTYTNLQELGESIVRLGDHDLYARGAEAYVDAYALAATSAEQARTIARYAELLLASGDPQRALTYIHEAQKLDSTSQSIADLAKVIDHRAAVITTESIRRGLGDLAFKPLKLQLSASTNEEQSTASGGSATAPTVDPLHSINVPMNFEFNSTRLDTHTASNVAILASALASPEFAGKRFVFVGHADRRGTAEGNMTLSINRALAIYAAVIALQPSLAGRINTEGRGATEPLASGDTEEDYRINRRLQVLLL